MINYSFSYKDRTLSANLKHYREMAETENDILKILYICMFKKNTIKDQER